MKKFILLITFSIALISCKVASKDYTIISGQVLNKTSNAFTINSFDGKLTQAVNISENGSFTDTLNLKEGNYVLFDGENRVFLHLDKGNQLLVNYDASDFEKTIEISGKGSDISNYLLKKNISEKSLVGDAESFYALSEVDFKNKLNQIKSSHENLLNSHNAIPKEYKAKEKRNLNYFSLAILKDYEDAHQEFTKNANFKVSEDFLKDLNVVDYTNEDDFLFSRYYKALVTHYYRNKSSKLMETDALPYEAAYFKTLSTIENQTIKNTLLFDYAKYSMGYSKDVEMFYNNYMAISTDNDNNEEITEVYNKLTALTKGKPSPKFIDYENYKGGTTSLDDLKGKYVYVDVWATWCGPCIAEIPALKTLEKEFHDKNIEFVSISIDKTTDKAKWQQMILEKDLKGLQLFADNDWKSSFVRAYNIMGIPRFILIDPNGNIVNANAPRPSSSSIKELFSSLVHDKK